MKNTKRTTTNRKAVKVSKKEALRQIAYAIEQLNKGILLF